MPETAPNPDATKDFEETDRFTEIATLKAGWHDGEGDPVTPVALSEGRRIRDLLSAANIDCCVFPTLEGGVAIEDVAEKDEDCFTITINPDGSATVLTINDDDEVEDHEQAASLPGASAVMKRLLTQG